MLYQLVLYSMYQNFRHKIDIIQYNLSCLSSTTRGNSPTYTSLKGSITSPFSSLFIVGTLYKKSQKLSKINPPKKHSILLNWVVNSYLTSILLNQTGKKLSIKQQLCCLFRQIKHLKYHFLTQIHIFIINLCLNWQGRIDEEPKEPKSRCQV